VAIAMPIKKFAKITHLVGEAFAATKASRIGIFAPGGGANDLGKESPMKSKLILIKAAIADPKKIGTVDGTKNKS